MDNYRKELLKKVTLKKPYVFIFIVIFLGFFALNALINQLYVTGLGILDYDKGFVIPFIFFLFVIPGLVALNVNLGISKFRELRHMNNKGSVSTIGFLGIFAGILGGGCPGCFIGLFPAFLGILGVTGSSLSILPFNGLEIQLASAIFLIFGAYFLTKPVSCKIN